MTPALIWLQEDRISETGLEADARDSALVVHTCFLIKSLSLREENIRDIAVNLLIQLRDKFPQVNLRFYCVCTYFFYLMPP